MAHISSDEQSSRASTEIVQEKIPGLGEGEILVIRSTRRKKSVSAYRQGGKIIISIPAKMSKAEERMVVPQMIATIKRRESEAALGEAELAARIPALLSEYAPEISERPLTVSWRSMRERWGSCTTVDRTIRISDRLQGVPDYVLDYVLFHEAIHLRHHDHGHEFSSILERFGDGELASAFLDGFEIAERRHLPPIELEKFR
jgi:predicted metal-dependent hydrolase